MLTLKGAGYTIAELKTLRKVIETAQYNIMHIHPCTGQCDKCAVRHACGDLARLQIYLDKELRSRDPEHIDNGPGATP